MHGRGAILDQMQVENPSDKVGMGGQNIGLSWSRSLSHPPLRLPSAFTGTHQVTPAEIDDYAHVNNAVYLQWLDRIAWTHAAILGTPLASCLAMRRGMAVRHTRIDYLEAAVLGDTLLLATWLVACDGRLRCTRRFEILRLGDGKRVVDAEIEYFCLNLDTGKPCRFPREFAQSYTVIPEVAAAYRNMPRELRHIGYSRGSLDDVGGGT
jgi:acyl-CoA thioester hydrolase